MDIEYAVRTDINVDAEEITTELTERLKSDKFNRVTFVSIHGKNIALRDWGVDKDELVIGLWCIPSEILRDPAMYVRGQLKKVTIEGEELTLANGQQDGYLIDPDTIPKDYTLILDDASNVLAFLYERHLWITFDLLHSPIHTSKLWTYIFNQLGMKIQKLDANYYRRKFKSEYKAFISKRLPDIRRRYENSRKTLENAELNWNKAYEKLRVDKEIYDLTKEKVADQLKSLEELWDRIYDIPEISDIKVVGQRIVCTTKELMLGPFNIGPFTIAIDKNRVTVSMINKPYVGYDRYVHPHVDQNGNPCLAGTQNAMKHYHDGDWDLTILTIVKLLETYNGLGHPFTSLEAYLHDTDNKEAIKEYKKLLRTNGKKTIVNINTKGEIEYD